MSIIFQNCHSLDASTRRLQIHIIDISLFNQLRKEYFRSFLYISCNAIIIFFFLFLFYYSLRTPCLARIFFGAGSCWWCRVVFNSSPLWFLDLILESKELLLGLNFGETFMIRKAEKYRMRIVMDSSPGPSRNQNMVATCN